MRSNLKFKLLAIALLLTLTVSFSQSQIVLDGGGGLSSLAVGSTPVTGGTTGRVLYDNAGVLGEMTTTGSGTVLALATAPVFGTSISTPIITSVGDITFKSSDTTSIWQINSTSYNFLPLFDNVIDIGDFTHQVRRMWVGSQMNVGAAGTIGFVARASFASPADGILELIDNAGTSFNRVQWGGTTSSYPSLQRSTTVLKFRLADDSADSAFQASTGTLTNLASDATHTDNSVCVDTGSGLLYKGSGTIGICLGTSSARFKQDIQAMPDVDIMALKPISFRYIKGYGDDGAKPQFGFLAEEAIDTVPQLVGLDAEGRPNSMDLVGLIPLLVREVQELKRENARLRHAKSGE